MIKSDEMEEKLTLIGLKPLVEEPLITGWL